MQTKPKSFWQRARDAVTGRFMKLVDALRKKDTSVVQKVPKK